MFTVVLAWLALAAVLAGAVLFGQAARTAPPPRRPRPRSARVGLLASLSGPWLVALLSVGAGGLTGAWLPAATFGVCGIAFVALVGVTLHPH